MKQITKRDINKLYQKFKRYLLNAEQYEFVSLFPIDKRFDITMEHIEKDPRFIENNQKDLNAMFRVVLEAMGEDYSGYLDDELDDLVLGRSWVEKIKEYKSFNKYNYKIEQVNDYYILTTPMLPETFIKVWEKDNQYHVETTSVNGIGEAQGNGEVWVYQQIKMIILCTKYVQEALLKAVKEKGSAKEAFNKLKTKLGELTEEEEKLVKKVERGLNALMVFKEHLKDAKIDTLLDRSDDFNIQIKKYNENKYVSDDYFIVTQWLNGERNDGNK